jgi:acetylxylan esterase
MPYRPYPSILHSAYLSFSLQSTMFKAAALVVLVALAAGSLASPVNVEIDARAECFGTTIIVARGSTEAPGTGVTGETVASLVTNQVEDSNTFGLDYPATLENYESSESAGVESLLDTIAELVDACPDTQVVLMGYSQGAQVIGDTLCGSGHNSPLVAKYGGKSEYYF